MTNKADPMSQDIAYTNARLLDPASGLDAPGGLLTRGDRIIGVGPRLFNEGVPPGTIVVDLAGRCLAPGFVDMRVAIGEPGEEHKESIQTASRAAAAGGVTALACLPDTDPPIDDVSGVEFIARRAREVKLVKIFAQAAVTRGLEGRELAEIGLLDEAGAVAFTDGATPVADARVMAGALSYASTFGTVIVQHPEEPSLARGGAMNGGELSTRLGLPGVPRAAEVILIERDLRLVAMTGGRYHAAHVSTREGVEEIRAAKQRGLPVTCDTSPAYFTLTEADVGEYRTFAKLSPPLRTADDQAALLEGLADGTIDAIASDHRPQDQDSKRLPFAQAAFGIIGLETLLPLTLAQVANGRLSLARALGAITHRPADILRLPLGRLAPGRAADLTVFDPDQRWTIDEAGFRSKSKNSPFHGWKVTGRTVRCVVDGRSVFHAEAAAAN